MRLFLAITPPDNLRRELAALLLPFSAELPGRWPPPENLHLTLAFLGEREDGRRREIEAAAEIAGRCAPFPVVWGGVGAFPGWRRARVVYLGVRKGGAELAGLAHRLVEALPEDLRPPGGRSFRAHLTLARFREPPGPAGLRRLAEELAPLSWRSRVDAIELQESRLHPSGARYRLLSRIPLSG